MPLGTLRPLVAGWHLVGGLVGLLAGSLAGWLAGSLVGSLAGWLAGVYRLPRAAPECSARRDGSYHTQVCLPSAHPATELGWRVRGLKDVGCHLVAGAGDDDGGNGDDDGDADDDGRD
eukprot:2471924-Pyramimonas_sp.AAC.1